MLNRVLVKFSSEKEVEYLARYAKLLKKDHSELEISGLYVHPVVESESYKDYRGIGDDYDISEVQKKHEEKLKRQKASEEKIKEKFMEIVGECKFNSRSGECAKAFLDELRLFDLGIVAKSDPINHGMKEVLEQHHKPIIIVPEMENYSFEKILVADDERLEVNKAFFNFIGLFDKIKDFKAVSVGIDPENKKDLNEYLKKIGKKIEYNFESGDVDKVILNYSEDCDLLIMGDLKYSFIFEKISGKTGIKLIEDMDKPIFIA